jgi:putative DNA primase/helicase
MTETFDDGSGERELWPAPDNPRPVARRIADMAKAKGQPLCYWNEMWFFWNGRQYQEITVETIRDNLYEILGDAKYIGAQDTELNWKPTPGKLNGVIDAARGLVKLPGGVRAAMWLDGRDELVIPCANGLLHVSARNLLLHTPDYFNIMSLPYDYDASAECPRWLRFLEEVFGDDAESVALLQQWFGYVLSGRTDLQKMLMMIGPKRGGKGTIARLLKRLVGASAYAAIKTQDLRSNFAFQSLVDKSLVVFPDERQVGAPDGKRLVQFVLQATGEDDIQVERKYKAAWNGRLPMRLTYMGNEMPVLPDSSGAVLNRLLVIEMLVSFTGREDRGLDDALAAELPGILNWALDGLDELRQHGDFRQPESGRDLLVDIDNFSNPIRQFLTEECVFGADQETECGVLKQRFDSWCYFLGIEGKWDARWFGRHLRPAMRDLAPDVKFERKQRDAEPGRPHYYMGIGLAAIESGGPGRVWP